MSQPPTSKYPDMGEVTGLRLELCRERDRANAFEKALTTELLKVAKVAILQAAIDAEKSSDADMLGCMAVELADLRAENERLKAEVDLWKLRSDNWQKLVQAWQAAKDGKPSV